MSWLYWVNRGKTKKCRVCGKDALTFQIETERLRDENGKPVEILEDSDDQSPASPEVERDTYKQALIEALPECWDTPKAQEIIKDALGESDNG
jgi:hypothetical protein